MYMMDIRTWESSVLAPGHVVSSSLQLVGEHQVERIHRVGVTGGFRDNRVDRQEMRVQNCQVQQTRATETHTYTPHCAEYIIVATVSR